MPAAEILHLDLDGAWPKSALAKSAYLDCHELGPRVRYSATTEAMTELSETLAAQTAPFVLFGSGDFHHVSNLLVHRVREPFTLVSFDNHPDWDIRPPRWCCGTWINRALTSKYLKRVAVWGCGNFELNRPSSFFVNHFALRAGRLSVRPWRERLPASTRRRWPTIERDAWRAPFEEFAESLKGHRLYVTVDLDCLREEEAWTNWENGLFTASDIAWCLQTLRSTSSIIAGDLCGAYSEPLYARFKQRIEAALDHPKLPSLDPTEGLRRNLASLAVIWPALTDRYQSHADGDQGKPQPELGSHALL